MGDNTEPNIDHAVETPSAEYLSDAAVDGAAPSVGTPLSRGNSPASGGSEGTNAGLGALQVVSSSGAAHDETWNSFLDVCPVLVPSTLPFTNLVLTLHLDSTETIRRRQDLESKSIDVSI